MPVVHNAELIDILVNGGESAKSLNRPGVRGCSRWLTPTKVQVVIIAKLDRLREA